MSASEFSDVFVSYRRKNVEFVKQLVENLSQDGKEVWIDWQDIPPGVERFADEIKRGIEGADMFLAVLSPDYWESPYCVGELRYASELNKKIIPIVIKKFDDYEVPESVSHINWIYFVPHAGQTNTYDESYPKILSVMETDLDYVRNHKRLLLRAIRWEESHKDHHFLLSGSEIDPFQDWLNNAAGKQPIPIDLQKEYVNKSIANQKRQQRRLLLGVTTALVISIILSIVSLISLNAAEIARGEADASLVIAETERANAEISEANAVAEKERAEVAEADALQRARLADSRALANELLTIYANDPFLAYGLALELVNATDIPDFDKFVARGIVLNGNALRRFEGHDGNVNTVAHSPDGETVISGSDDGILFLWNSKTGEIIQQFEGHDGAVMSAEFSPDGTKIISGSLNNSVILWDVEAGTAIEQFDGHSSPIITTIFLDNETVLSGSEDGIMIVWDIQTGEIVGDAIDLGLAPINAIAVSPDRQKVLVAVRNFEENLYLWNFTDDSGQFLDGHVNFVTDVTFSADGQTALSASDDFSLIHWDIETGEIIDILLGHTDWVKSVSFSPDGQTALSSSMDGDVILWNLSTGSLLIVFSGHADPPLDVSFDPNGEHAISASADNSLILWDLTVEGESVPVAARHDSRVDFIGFDVDGDTVASQSSDGILITWSVDTGDVLKVYDDSNFDEFFDEFEMVPITVTVEGLPTLSFIDEYVTLQQIATDEIIQFEGHDAPVTSAGFNPDGQSVISGSQDGTLILWSHEDGQLTQQSSIEGHTETVIFVGFSPDGQVILSSSQDDTLILWDVEDGQLVQRSVLEGHVDDVDGFVFKQDSSTVVSVSKDNNAILWDVESGERLATFTGHRGDVWAVAYHPTEPLILTGSQDNTVIIWDTISGEQVRFHNWHTDDVTRVMFSPDGLMALSGSYNGEVYAWNIGTSDEDLQALIEDRQIVEITCDIRERFRTPDQCDEEGES